MDWLSTSLILFSCVAINHLGLVAAIERTVRRRLPIVNCPKCLTFWSVLMYGLASGNYSAPFREWLGAGLSLLATSFLAAYLAAWLELSMYAIDTLYNYIYDKISNQSQKGDEAASG